MLLSALATPALCCSAVEFTPPTNGVYLAFGGGAGGSVSNNPIRFDQELVFQGYCDTGQVDFYYPREPYTVKVSMIGPAGRPVAKTLLGKKLGSKFDELCADDPPRQGSGVLAWGPYRDNPGLGGGRILPRPRDMFRMDKPGIYTLEIEVQLLRKVRRPNQFLELVRFAPVRIKVEKPEEKDGARP
jgi:hypothetical protein